MSDLASTDLESEGTESGTAVTAADVRAASKRLYDVVALLSGGKLDMTMLQTLMSHELTARSQQIRLEVRIQDELGVMGELATTIAEQGGNIRTVDHVRSDDRRRVGEAFLEFLVETSGHSHATDIRDAIASTGYDVQRIN